jgi:hypothetical protein
MHCSVCAVGRYVGGKIMHGEVAQRRESFDAVLAVG